MNKHLIASKPILKSVAFFFIAFLLIQILIRSETFVNEFYPKFYVDFYPWYTQVFGWISFSIGDIIYFIILLYYIFNVYVILRCAMLKQKWRALLFLSKLIKLSAVLYLTFHILWGFNYHRTAILSSYEPYPYTEDELKMVANIFLKQAKDLRHEVNEDNLGIFTYEKQNFLEDISSELATYHPFPYKQIPQKSKKKWSLYSWLMRYFGVSGYYNPFTAEAQVTYDIPDISLPFTLAHEQAHQMGYAPEGEANFIGFLTCYNSKSKSLQYSANYKALKYILREIYKSDSVFVHQILEDFSPAMKRDYEAEKTFYKRYEGQANDAFSQMNHVYLKSNQQAKGIESYNQFVDLIMHHVRYAGF